LEGGLRPAFTDSAGEFWIDSVAPGRWTVRFRKLGFSPLRLDFALPEGNQDDVELDDIVLPLAEPRTITIAGAVREVIGGRPIEGVLVRAGGSIAGYSDASGRFLGRAVVRGGTMVEVSRMGFRPARFELWPASVQDTVSLAIGLRPVAIRLGEIVVEADRPVASRTFDFERHQRAGFGTFLTEERIRTIGSFSAVDLLRWAGVQVRGDIFADNGRFLQIFGAPYSCEGRSPVIFINGRQWPPETAMPYLETTDPNELIGVEVYRRSGGIPLEYHVPDAECGVVAVWYRQ